MDRIEPIDYLDIKKVMDVQVSKTHVAWVELTPDAVEKGYTSHIKVLSKESGAIHQFTSGSEKDSHPRFSNDGSKLAFLSNRKDKNQIYVMPMTGGEGIKLTKARI